MNPALTVVMSTWRLTDIIKPNTYQRLQKDNKSTLLHHTLTATWDLEVYINQQRFLCLDASVVIILHFVEFIQIERYLVDFSEPFRFIHLFVIHTFYGQRCQLVYVQRYMYLYSKPHACPSLKKKKDLKAYRNNRI